MKEVELGIINSYIFSIRPGEYLPQRPVADLYKKYSKKLETVQKSSHKARKTFTTALIDGDVNINSVKTMIGHSDARTTYKSYVFDRSTDAERRSLMEAALRVGD